MIEFKFEDYSPEHEKFNHEFVEAAISDGAAKISNLLTVDSVRLIRRHGLSFKPSTIKRLIPELNPFFEIFSVDDLSPTRGNVYQVEPSGNSIISAHVDGVDNEELGTFPDVQEGLSLLMPVSGRRALLGADELPFENNSSPNVVFEYGLTDAILIRQRIRTINGIGEFHDNIWHLGLCATVRNIAMLDLMNPEINYRLPTTSAATAATAT